MAYPLEPRRQPWKTRLVALLVALVGVVNVLSAVTPSQAGRVRVLRPVVSVAVQRGGHLTAALAGFALLVLARALWRRKRVAWWLTLLVLGISVLSHLEKGLDWEEASLAAAVGAWLWTLRPLFSARSDEPSVRQGLQALLAAFGFTLAYGVLGFYLLDQHFSVTFSLLAALRQTVVMFTEFYNPGLQPITGFGRYFAGSIYGIALATLGYAAWMLLRPVILRRPPASVVLKQARAIVEAHGRSSLARFALLPDKQFFFSPGGSLVAFVQKGRIALALGDPIGPAGDVGDSIRAFGRFAAEHDWLPAFYQVLPDDLDAYRAAGFDALPVGEEGIVDLHTFTLAGGSNKTLRNAVNKLSKSGYRAQPYAPPLPDDLLVGLRATSEAWLAMAGGEEMRFSLGWFEEAYVRSTPVMVVHDDANGGQIVAFANIVPEYQRNEATLDLMRHRPDALHGTMDFLFISLFQWAQAQGYDTFNLGLSALSGVGIEANDPLVERALHYIYENVEGVYNFKGLHTFKEKYHPTWSPRYLVYPGAISLPVVAVALVRAQSGDDVARAYLKEFIAALPQQVRTRAAQVRVRFAPRPRQSHEQ